MSIAAPATLVSAQTPAYRVVADWPRLPPGSFFGTQAGFPSPAEREAGAAARVRLPIAGTRQP